MTDDIRAALDRSDATIAHAEETLRWLQGNTAKRDSISLDEYCNRANGWSLHRSFQTAEAAQWYFDRLPDECGHSYRLVEHPTRHIIATRYSFAHSV